MKYLIQKKWIRKFLLLLIDAMLLAAALYCAYVLRFEHFYDGVHFHYTRQHLAEILAIYLVIFAVGGIYDILWRYAGGSEVLRLAVLCGLACSAAIALDMWFVWNVSRGMLIIHALLSIAFVGASRLAWRMFLNSATIQNRLRHRHTAIGPRMMIVGAGNAGVYMLNMCKNNPALGQPILFVDHDKRKQKLRIHGIAVHGGTEDIPMLAAKHEIQEIVIAIPSLKGAALNALVETCKSTACRVRILMQMQNSDEQQSPGMFVRELNISDFLSRDEITLDTQGISDYLTDKCVLVTGGGGSIGSELCRQILRFSPRLLVIFDIYENCAYELECELRQRYGKDCPILVLIGSVREPERLKEVFDAYQPEVVFHAAAHKHVPLMEVAPAEAVKNNVFGTLNVLEAADAHGVDRFVLLSTDKAVNPTNVMGATKRVTEMLMQDFARKTRMKCMAVRFGNVLGSHGSVIPLFERQIRVGGPVTVTHPDIIRYFMTIPEAAQLVLQAGSIARSGSICVLDMGEPVRIADLAKQLIRFHGYEPGVNMDITYTGLRPGEKLYEELLTDRERSAMERTAHEKIMIAPAAPQDPAVFAEQLETLRTAAEHNDAGVVQALVRMVPGFSAESVKTA